MAATAGPSTTACRVGVRDVVVGARIGAHAHEHGRVQPLRISVELVARPPVEDRLASTFDYADIPAIIEDVAQTHICLIEQFATCVAERCAERPGVHWVEVRVEKPSALPNGLAWTAIEITNPPAGSP